MIPCNRCKRERSEIAARVAAKRPRSRAERVEMCRDESEKSEQHTFAGFLSPPHKAWPSSRGVGNAQGAQAKAHGRLQNGLQGPAWGRYPPRRRRRAELTAQGAKRKSARFRRQAWQGSTGKLGERAHLRVGSTPKRAARTSGTRRQT